MNNITEGFASGLFSTLIPLLMIYAVIMLTKQNIKKLFNQKRQSKPYQKEKQKYTNYISTTQMANYFGIEPKEMNKIFSDLKWCYKSGEWWIATDLGKINGASQEYSKKYNKKYIKWEEELKYDEDIIKKVNQKLNSNSL